MSTKFEQLLDYLVNEDMEKANELFHEIVVEKSRDIYENLIAEEEQTEMDEADDMEDESIEETDDMEDESIEETDDDTDESVEEGMDEEADESVDLEDSYSMEGDDEEDPMAVQDKSDKFGDQIGATDPEDGAEASEDEAIFDFKDAFEKLEAAFQKLEAAQGAETGDMGMGGMDDMDGGGDMMGKPAFEGRRVTREYVETVGNDWEKSGSQKAQGKYVGAGSGDKEGGPQEGRSPISSGKGKPNTGATAENILRGGDEGGTPTGTSPAGKAGGFLSAAKDMKTGNQNVPGGKVSVKGLTKVAGGHGAEKKGSGPGPVGSGTGDKAGQTSVGVVKSPLNGAPNRNA
jgi:hypothetical protein